MIYEIKFELSRNGVGQINGLKLNAMPQTEAVRFCTTFPTALADNTADIIFEDNKIIFKHPKCDFPGEFCAELSADEAEELKKVISRDRKLSVEEWSAWGGGFRLYVKDL